MFLFNSDNDLSLANFSPNYTPPASALKLNIDLSVLPIWYAPNNSIIATESILDKEFVEFIQRHFELDSTIVSFDKICNYKSDNIFPWGWSPMLRKKLIEAGISEDTLPTIDELKLIRDYSNRKNAVRMLSELKMDNSQYYGDSFFFTDINKLLDYLTSYEDDKALKKPLSGSGRGLIWILDGITDKQTDWGRNVIRDQGGVVAEPKLNKVQDLAMEFSITDGAVNFEGYSLFESAASGAYMGNILMSDNDIEMYLSEYITIDLLHNLRHTLIEKLAIYFPHYNGILGVDMMICMTDDGYKLQPCVEINMRMNMGVVAHKFYNKYVAQSSRGIYKVEFFKQKGSALVFHNESLEKYPLVINNMRIESGYMSLAPVNENTQYIAYVLIETL